MRDPDKCAIVIGASMGGLLAARALADYYGQVIIVERDALPEDDEPRKGVPHGRHTHGLLARGREVLEELLPGFTQEIVAQGASPGDIADKVLWFNHGFYLRNAPSKLLGLAVSRPMLEGSVRRRVLHWCHSEDALFCPNSDVTVCGGAEDTNCAAIDFQKKG